MTNFRVETDSLGEVQVPSDKLWGAQTQRSLEHFSIGDDLIPREMILSYAVLKKAAALVNHRGGRLPDQQTNLIVQVCDEILAGQHHDQFPLHVWMTGSGTQFNMNVNEVISNRCCQLAETPLGSKKPVHPNDHVNMSQSSNDSFPSAMCIATVQGTKERLLPVVQQLREALNQKAQAWQDIVKIGRTHLQDATPLTLGQEFSGYMGMLSDNLERLEQNLQGVYRLALGGTAVGTGINTVAEFDKEVAQEIAHLTGLPFVTAPNKFTVQGSHDALVQFSGTLKTLATSLYKIANDIRLLSCGPRCGFAELHIPENEPGSSIMPGKVNPTQCEALAMLAVQVMANDMAVTIGGGGYLEMNVYKPLIIFNIMKSIRLLQDGCHNFRVFLVEGTKPNHKQIDTYVQQSLMLVTALSPAIGYDKASQVAHYALDHDLTLSIAHKGHVKDILRNWPVQDVRFICVTDGGRILGLGDLGANGAPLLIGKLQLYTATAGVPPQGLLPMYLDAGTNNETLLNDPLYFGLRQHRPATDELYAFVDEFVDAVQEVFPLCCIHFEDWTGSDAINLLARYRDKVCCYNDDIQGTGGVTLAGLVSALKISNGKLKDQRILFLGAGSAAIGIANLIVTAMTLEGLSTEQAQAQISMFDVNGLLEPSRKDLFDYQKPYAHPHEPTKDFVEAIKSLKPTGIIGVSTAGKAFTQQVVETMSQLNERPIIFALSNPTDLAECSAEDAYKWSKGKALYAAGVQFPPVHYNGQTLLPGQANNFYVFPAVGMAIYATQAKRVTDKMFIESAYALSDQVTPDQLKQGLLYPSQSNILETGIKTATRVAKIVFDLHLARVERPADLEAFIRSYVYKPEYQSLV